jgi:hypothetical protein
MKILPLIQNPICKTPNYSLSQCKPKPNLHTQPSFQGGLSDKQMNKIVDILSNKNTEVIERMLFDRKLIDDIARQLQTKHKTSNVGLQILTDNHLAKFLGKKPFETQHQVGLCVAVGDKRGPIESWNKVYEAKTILINKEMLLRDGFN